MPEMLEKVRFVRETCERLNIRKSGVVQQEGHSGPVLPPFDIEVDGGIDVNTAPLCIEAGANVLVSGTYLYGTKDMRKAIETLRGSKNNN